MVWIDIKKICPEWPCRCLLKFVGAGAVVGFLVATIYCSASGRKPR